MDHTHGSNDLLGQKLTFRIYEHGRNVSHYWTATGKSHDARAHRSFFHRSIEVINKNDKKFFSKS